MKLTPIHLTLILCLAASISAAERKWSDSTGRFSITAELVSVAEGKVTLKRSDGKSVTLPVSRLSKADQEFVRSRIVAKENGTKKEKRQSDIEKIQGLWRLTRSGGERSRVRDDIIRISKDFLEYGRMVDGVFEPVSGKCKLTLDESKTPKQLGFVDPDKKFPQNTALYTYALDGDSLVLNSLSYFDGKSRPTTIVKKQKEGELVTVDVFVRVDPTKFKKQPRESQKPSRPKKMPEDTKILPGSDLAKMQGLWDISDHWVDGKVKLETGFETMQITRNAWQIGGVEDGKFRDLTGTRYLRLDETKMPKQLGAPSDTAVYSLDGDTLIWCTRVDGKPVKSVPKKGRKGDGLDIMVLTRVASKGKLANPAAIPRGEEKPSTKIQPDRNAATTKVDRKLTAELTGIRIVRERTSGPIGDRQTTSMELTLWIKGKNRTNAGDGIVQLSQLAPIVDDQGNLLSTKKRLKAIEFYQRDARTQLTYNGPEGSGPMLTFLVDAPARKATKIKQIKGRVEITTTGTQRIVFEKLPTLVGKPLKHKLLGDLRIVPELTVGDDGTDLTLHMTGKHHLVKYWHLEDGGRHVRASMQHEGRRHPTIKEVGRGYAARVSEKAALVLTVRTGGVQQVVEFEFNDVELP